MNESCEARIDVPPEEGNPEHDPASHHLAISTEYSVQYRVQYSVRSQYSRKSNAGETSASGRCHAGAKPIGMIAPRSRDDGGKKRGASGLAFCRLVNFHIGHECSIRKSRLSFRNIHLCFFIDMSRENRQTLSGGRLKTKIGSTREKQDGWSVMAEAIRLGCNGIRFSSCVTHFIPDAPRQQPRWQGRWWIGSIARRMAMNVGRIESDVMNDLSWNSR